MSRGCQGFSNFEKNGKCDDSHSKLPETLTPQDPMEFIVSSFLNLICLDQQV
jgi:hypothetical protein